MSRDDNPLPEGDIEAVHVLPALLTSLRFGVTEAELGAALGWSRATLEREGARVGGASTYAHLEMMYARPGYADFIVAAARANEATALGVVGLACKTSENLGEALACHGRYQHLTNRTARYESVLASGKLRIREIRFGPPRLGSLLMSEYAMLVAARLLSLIVAEPLPVRELRVRRARLSPAERRAYESFIGVAPTPGSSHAELVLDARAARLPVVRADAELAAFFERLLRGSRAAPADEPVLLRDVRLEVRERLLHGQPSLEAIARALALGPRTLQRRLASHGRSFADLVDDVRRDAAKSHLRAGDLTLSEIAYALGFREQASFYRAFRRWYGTTPYQFRRDAEAKA